MDVERKESQLRASSPTWSRTSTSLTASLVPSSERRACSFTQTHRSRTHPDFDTLERRHDDRLGRPGRHSGEDGEHGGHRSSSIGGVRLPPSVVGGDCSAQAGEEAGEGQSTVVGRRRSSLSDRRRSVSLRSQTRENSHLRARLGASSMRGGTRPR